MQKTLEQMERELLKKMEPDEWYKKNDPDTTRTLWVLVHVGLQVEVYFHDSSPDSLNDEEWDTLSKEFEGRFPDLMPPSFQYSNQEGAGRLTAHALWVQSTPRFSDGMMTEREAYEYFNQAVLPGLEEMLKPRLKDFFQQVGAVVDVDVFAGVDDVGGFKFHYGFFPAEHFLDETEQHEQPRKRGQNERTKQSV